MDTHRKTTGKSDDQTQNKNKAQEALKAYLNEIVLKPLKDQQTGFLPTLKGEITNGSDAIQEIIERDLGSTQETLKSITTEIETVKTNQNSSNKSILALKERTEAVAMKLTDQESRAKTIGTSVEKVNSATQKNSELLQSIQALTKNTDDSTTTLNKIIDRIEKKLSELPKLIEDAKNSNLKALSAQIEEKALKLSDALEDVKSKSHEDLTNKTEEVKMELKGVVSRLNKLSIALFSATAAVLGVVIIILVKLL